MLNIEDSKYDDGATVREITPFITLDVGEAYTEFRRTQEKVGLRIEREINDEVRNEANRRQVHSALDRVLDFIENYEKGRESAEQRNAID